MKQWRFRQATGPAPAALARVLVLCVSVLVACRQEHPERPAVAESNVVGTWRAIEPTVAGRPGTYLVYDATGHVFFIQGAGRPTVTQGVDSGPVGPFADHSAYVGTYTVYPAEQRVVHRIEGESPPRHGALEIGTQFRVAGDTLVVGSRVFLRVRR